MGQLSINSSTRCAMFWSLKGKGVFEGKKIGHFMEEFRLEPSATSRLPRVLAAQWQVGGPDTGVELLLL